MQRSTAHTPLAATIFLTLAVASGCAAELDDDPAVDASADAFRDYMVTFPTLDLAAVNPTSGRVLNTHGVGFWEFSGVGLAPGANADIELIALHTGGQFVQNKVWEIDDVSPYTPVDISSLTLDAHMLTGVSVGGQPLRHADFHGSIWTVKVGAEALARWTSRGQGVSYISVWDNGVEYGLLDLRLSVGWSTLPPSAVEPESWGDEDQFELDFAHAGAIPLYTFWYEKDGRNDDDDVGWFETCSVPDGAGVHSTTAVLLEDLDVDDEDFLIDDDGTGEVMEAADSLYLACVTGAVGKAAIWGYWPREMTAPTYPSDSLLNFETIVRMVRADYCGDGTSHTQEGTPIGVADRMGVRDADSDLSHAPSDYFEAVWYAGGADCVNYVRDPSQSLGCYRVSCDQLDSNGSFSYFNWAPYTHFLTWK